MSKKKKLKQGESYIRDNRPKGISKREWDKARKSEGLDPRARFFSDPVAERKKAQKSSTPTRTSGGYGGGTKTYTELTSDEKAQADSYIESIKQNTFQDASGNLMSMDPNIAKQKGYINPFQSQPTNPLTQQQPPQVQSMAPPSPQDEQKRKAMENAKAQAEMYRQEEKKNVLGRAGNSTANFYKGIGKYAGRVKENPKEEYKKFTEKTTNILGLGDGREKIAPLESDRQREINKELEMISAAQKEIEGQDFNIFGLGLRKENAAKIKELQNRRMQLSEEYRNASSDELKKAKEKADAERVFAIATMLETGGANMYKEIAKSQSPAFIKSFLKGKVDDVALEKITPQLVAAKDAKVVKSIIDTAQGLVPKQGGMFSRFFSKKPEQPKVATQPKTQAIKEIVEGKPAPDFVKKGKEDVFNVQQYMANPTNKIPDKTVTNIQKKNWFDTSKLEKNPDGTFTVYRVGKIEPGKPNSFSTTKKFADQTPYRITKEDIILDTADERFIKEIDNAYTKDTAKEVYSDAVRHWNNFEGEILVKPSTSLSQTSKLTQPLSQGKATAYRSTGSQGQIVRGNNSYNSIIPNDGASVNTTAQTGKPSKFAQRVAPDVPKPLKAQLDEVSYNPSSNKDVINKVRNVIAQSEDDALKLARQENSVEANAAATELIGKYLKEGQFEKAAALTKEVSPRFSNQGQQIQILSQYGKLTPEGATRFAQKIVDEANAKLPTSKKIQLKGSDLEELAKQAEKIQGLKEGTREYAIEVAKLMDGFASKIPASVGQKIATIQTMAQLLNPKTAIRNVVGNAFLGGMENVSDVAATGIDKILSKTLFQGQRSMALPSIKAQGKGAVSGFKLGLEDALMGVDTGALGTQFDLPRKTFRGGILGALEKGLNIELRSTDRAFYKAAYDGALESMMRANKVKVPTPEMKIRAGEEGLYRTFQNNSKLAEMLTGLKRQLNRVGTPGGEFGLGDLINKYPKTPGNIVSVGMDYSPIGLVKAANNIVKATRGITPKTIGAQREIAQNIARSLTGTGLIASGYVLAKNGIITGQKEKDYDINQQYRETGQGPFKLNIDALRRFVKGEEAKPKNGDTLVSYDWLQPNAIQFSMGANMAINNNKASEQLNTVIEGLSSGVDTLTDQPVIKGVTDFFRTATQTGGTAGITKGLVNAATNAPASFVPSLLNQMAQLRDNVARNTYSNDQVEIAINKVKQRIPGFRETLRPQIGTTGKELEQYQNGTNSIFNVMFNPSFISKINESPEAAMVLDIYERSGEVQQSPRLQEKKVKVNGQEMQLTGEQLEQMQRYTGELTTKAFERLVQDKEFQAMSDEDKAKKMSNIMTDIGKSAKVRILGDTATAKTEEQILTKATVDPETLKSFSQPEVKGKLYSKYQETAKANPVEAEKMLKEMDYPTYEAFKKERTAARASHTRQFKEYLASDNPSEATKFLETLEKEEKTRILNAMTPAMRARYNEGNK